MASPCQVKCIVNNLSAVDHWNSLKGTLKNLFGGNRSY